MSISAQACETFASGLVAEDGLKCQLPLHRLSVLAHMQQRLRGAGGLAGSPSGWLGVAPAAKCRRGASMEPAVSPGRSTWFRMGAALDATRQALVRRLQRFDRGILLAYSRSSPQPIENAPATS